MAISLSGGDVQAPPLPPGSQIPTKKSIVATLSTSMNTLATNLTRITEQVMSGLEGLEPGSIAQVVDRVNKTLDEAEGLLAEGRLMLGETTNTVASLREDSKEVIGEALSLAQDVKTLSSNVSRMVEVTTAKIEGFDVEQTEVQLTRALSEMADLAESLNATVAKFDELSANMLHEGSNIEFAIRNALGQVAQAFDALRYLVQQVREDPGSLVRGPSKIKEPEQ
jgi:ABC-type transporter Mla subunit MlaD